TVRYDVRPGIFKLAVTHARELYEKPFAAGEPVQLADRRLFKMSLGDTSKADQQGIYPDCLENGYVRLGFGSSVDFTGSDSLAAIRERYQAKHPGAKDTDFAITAVHRFKNELR